MLFILFGFFLPVFSVPVIGNINGIKLANLFSQLGYSGYSIALWLIPVLTILSILMGVFFYLSEDDTKSLIIIIADCLLLLGLLLCILMPVVNANEVTSSKTENTILYNVITEILSVGAYFILFGWLFAVIFSIASAVEFYRNISINIVFDNLKKMIDKQPIAVQMLIGIFLLLFIAAVGFGVFYFVDIFLLDLDPIGKVLR